MPFLVLWLVTGAAAPLKVAATQWRYQGLEAGQGDVYQERFLTLLSARTGIEVMTQRDLQAVLGLERQKQLLGCEEVESTCLAEISNALGADAVLSGSLAKTEKYFVISLRGVNSTTGKVFAVASGRLQGEDALFTWLEDEAAEFAARMRESFEAWVESRAVRPAVRYEYRRWPWVAVGGGLALAGIGAVLYGLSRVDLASIRSAPPPAGDPLISAGQRKQDSGVALAIAGTAVAAAGVVLLLVTRIGTTTIAVAPSADAGWLVIAGAW